MSILNKYDAIEKLIFEQGLRIKSVEIKQSNKSMVLLLSKNQRLKIPFSLYKGFDNASNEDLNNFKLIANGTGVHWPALDEDLSLKGFLREYLKQLIGSKKELIISAKKKVPVKKSIKKISA